MSELLSQDEVNALLQSMPGLDSSGAAAVDHAGTADGSAAFAAPTPYRKNAKRYDFKRPNRISKDVLQSLHFLHERYARSFAPNVSAFMRTVCEVTLVSVDQLSYGEFLLGLPEATCISVVEMRPQGAQLAFEISPALVFAVIEKLMGGSSDAPSQEREITFLEQSLVEGFIAVALGDLRDAWSTVGEADFALERSETSPQMVQIMAANEVVVVIAFEVAIGQTSGMMSFCLPAVQLEPFAARMRQEPTASMVKPLTTQELERLDGVLASAKSEVSANLCEMMLPIRKLLELKVGETLPLGVSSSDPVKVNVSGIPQYMAAFGARKGHKAVRILNTVENEDATREQEAAPFKLANIAAS